MSRPADTDDASAPRDMHALAESVGIPVAGATRLIARIWHGQTAATMADDYTDYLYEEGVRTIARIPGNCGVEMLRKVGEEIADFQVISYWDSLEAIKLFAGDDYEKVRHLPNDAKYVIGAEPTVEHFEVVVNDRPQR
jgi:heme-degrading monooxygenase HmoA